VEAGQLVVVGCTSPREKFWGVLLDVAPVGATLRGLPLPTFEDYLAQVAHGREQLLGAVTIFIPMHRVERIELDESSGAAEGLGERFLRTTGKDPREQLLGGLEAAPATAEVQ